MPVRSVLFDFMGTCLDWHSSIVAALPSPISESKRSALALEWRHEYFNATSQRLAQGEKPENIDVTHRNVLEALLSRPDNDNIRPFFTEDVKTECVRAWHNQRAWADVKPAIKELRRSGYEAFVHANGTTRLQLDLVRSSGLDDGIFDMLFSSELLGVYKPAAENYHQCLGLIGREASECITVAAHAYDTRGAKDVGMKTVYVYRWTDDVNENQEMVRNENDAWIEGMTGLVDVVRGLSE